MSTGLEFSNMQNLSDGWSITPALYIYSQSAAKFYVDAGPIDFPLPQIHLRELCSILKIKRLSAYGARTFGIKISKIWEMIGSSIFKYENYEQRKLAPFGENVKDFFHF